MFNVTQQLHWTREDGFAISTDKRYLDVETIFQFLNRESYWVKGIPKELVEVSIQNSLCYGIYEGDPAVGDAQ